MKQNKFTSGQIVYMISVTAKYVVVIKKVKITDFFYNKLPDHQKFIYSYKVLEQEILREWQVELTEEEKAIINDPYANFSEKRKLEEFYTQSNIISGSCGEDLMYEKIDDKIIFQKIHEKKEQEIRAENEAQKFRCPLTNGLLRQLPTDYRVRDADIKYKVEGFNHIWSRGSRWNHDIFITTYQGETRIFKYDKNSQNRWTEVIEHRVVGESPKFVIKPDSETIIKMIEIDNQRYDDDCKRKYEEERKKHPERFCQAKTIASELVNVQPLSSPIGTLHYIYCKTEESTTEPIWNKVFELLNQKSDIRIIGYHGFYKEAMDNLYSRDFDGSYYILIDNDYDKLVEIAEQYQSKHLLLWYFPKIPDYIAIRDIFYKMYAPLVNNDQWTPVVGNGLGGLRTEEDIDC